jgi:hypothetical protein
MDAAIVRGHRFKNVPKLRLRKAAEEGAIYFLTEAEVVIADKTRVVEIDHPSFDPTTGEVVNVQPPTSTAVDLLIVCEGDSDRIAISVLAERILSAAGSKRSIKITVAMGKLTMPRRTFQSDAKRRRRR